MERAPLSFFQESVIWKSAPWQTPTVQFCNLYRTALRVQENSKSSLDLGENFRVTNVKENMYDQDYWIDKNLSLWKWWQTLSVC